MTIVKFGYKIPNKMDKISYDENQHKKFLEHEALCKRCGACCGVKDNDPCEHLQIGADGVCFCGIYENRFGIRKTISGEPVLCVPLRNILHKTWWGRSGCAYVTQIR